MTPANQSKVSAYYSHEGVERAGFDPDKCVVRLAEVMALFNLLVFYAPTNPDAVRHAAWSRASQLRDELKLTKEQRDALAAKKGSK